MTTTDGGNIWDDAELISSYTRAQAIEDGVLVDISSTARQAGIKFPVAITRTAWGKYVELPEGYKGCQDESGRLWDVVWMLRFAIRRLPPGEDTLLYRLHVRRVKCVGDAWVDTSGETTPPLVTLKAVCGPGDDAEPVITVMLPDED